MGREFELKYRATEEVFTAVAEKYGPFRAISMETTYFDTVDGALAQRHITLRRRMENENSVCTVKTPLPDGSRGEWEIRWDAPETMVAALCDAGAPKELSELTKDGIVPVCAAKFTRLATAIALPDGEVELALDRGVLLGGGRERALLELEVEQKSGSDEATLAFAKALAAEFGLQPEAESKFRRAQKLAKGE